MPFACAFSAGFSGIYTVDCGDEWAFKTSIKKDSHALDSAEDSKDNEGGDAMVVKAFTSLGSLLAKKGEIKDL